MKISTDEDFSEFVDDLGGDHSALAMAALVHAIVESGKLDYEEFEAITRRAAEIVEAYDE